MTKFRDQRGQLRIHYPCRVRVNTTPAGKLSQMFLGFYTSFLNERQKSKNMIAAHLKYALVCNNVSDVRRIILECKDGSILHQTDTVSAIKSLSPPCLPFVSEKKKK